MHHPHSTYPHLFPPPLDPSLDGREPSASSAASSARSSSSSANLNAAPPPYSPPPHSHLDHVKMVPVHRQQSIPSHDPHAARPPHGGGPAPGQLAQLSPTRASSSKLALPPPPKPPYPRTDELARFEVMETLGTGTFGRVLLVRLRSPSTPANAPHPIFAQAPPGSGSPTSHPPSNAVQPGQRSRSSASSSQPMPHFALKVLAKSEIVRLKQVEHINNERAILGKVKHPFIVELYQTYQDSVNVYMLLSYVPGGELFSHLRRAGRFTPDVTRFYLSSIILAVAYLHSLDIIYRDLKPENLLLDREGYLRIADFGFAKEVEDRTFTLCGTPEYLAPEIVLSKGHGKAVDWWALGILCFEMLAGYPPFFDDNPMGIYEKILAAKIAFPPHIDSLTKDLIRRLLTVDRSKRLGNLRGGAMDVMMHPWFSGVDWGALERRQIRAPIIPPVADAGDTQNFQKYPLPRPVDLPGLFAVPPTPDAYGPVFEDF